MYKLMHQVKDNEKNRKITNVTQTLNVLNISTSGTYYVLDIRTNNITAMNKGLHCSKNLDCILFKANQVRNFGIGYYINTYYHNKKIVH